MNYLYFFINILLVAFFCYKLRLIGRGYLSAPGIYLGLSVLPTFTLLFPSEYASFEGRAGIGDYSLSLILHTGFMGVGLFAAYFIFNNARLPKRKFVLGPDSVVNEYRFVFNSALLLSFGSLLSQILILGDIPILSVFQSGDVVDLTNARESGYKLQESPVVYLWHFSRMVFIPFVVIASFIRYKIRPSKRSLLLFLGVLLFGIVHNSLSGAVAPVAMLFLCIGVAYIYVLGRIRLSLVAPFVVLIFVFPFLVEYAYSEDGFLDTLFYFSYKVINRFSFETFDRTLSYFDYFPYVKDYQGGRTNGLFMLFTGNEYFNVQNYIFLERLESFREHLLHGSANAHFIGYMNADFGLLGVGVSCLFVGIIIGLLDIVASKNIEGPAGLALYVVMGFIFWKLMGSQPTSVLFSHGAILCCLLIWVQKRIRVKSLRRI